jgi:hypothetical protein
VILRFRLSILLLELEILLAASEDRCEAMRGSRASNIHREAYRALSTLYRCSIVDSRADSDVQDPSETSRMPRRCAATGLTLKCKQKSQKSRSLGLRKLFKLTPAACGLTRM